MTHYDVYHLVITRSLGKDVFLRETPDGLRLPQATVPRHERLAHELTRAVSNQWGLNTVCLFGATMINRSDRHVHAMECVGMAGDPPSGGRWVSSALAASCLKSQEAETLTPVLSQLDNYNSGNLNNLFARSGWMPGLIEWVEKSLKPLDLHLTGPWSQIGGGLHSTLLRLETNKTAVWFKAAGEHCREFNVMTKLAALEPRFFPCVIASRPDWQAWLTLEASGSTLDNVTDSAQWLNAAASLGTLQAAFCNDDERLLQLECADWRADRVLANIGPLFDAMAEIMRKQLSQKVAPLSASRLKALGERVYSICERFYSLRAPSCLNNLDFNPTNIVSSAERVVFIDWASACLAHPFVTFEFLIADLLLFQPDLRCVVEGCRRAYAWTVQQGSSFADLPKQLRLSSLVAEVIYTITLWLAAMRQQTEDWDPLLRSMTRRLLRTSDALAAQEII